MTDDQIKGECIVASSSNGAIQLSYTLKHDESYAQSLEFEQEAFPKLLLTERVLKSTMGNNF